jgi:hypothetical protein
MAAQLWFVNTAAAAAAPAAVSVGRGREGVGCDCLYDHPAPDGNMRRLAVPAWYNPIHPPFHANSPPKCAPPAHAYLCLHLSHDSVLSRSHHMWLQAPCHQQCLGAVGVEAQGLEG